MFRKLFSKFIAISLISQAVACGATQGVTTLPTLTSNSDAPSALEVHDVHLLGLPGDSGQVIDGGVSGEVDAPLLFPGNSGEIIVPLHQNDRAPYNGVLFNGPAVARVQVEFQAQGERCVIERRRDTDLLVARYNVDVDTLRLAMDTQRRTDQVLLTSRDEDLARLNRLLTAQQRQNNGPHIGEGLIWGAGGLLLGVLVVGGLVIFTNVH